MFISQTVAHPSPNLGMSTWQATSPGDKVSAAFVIVCLLFFFFFAYVIVETTINKTVHLHADQIVPVDKECYLYTSIKTPALSHLLLSLFRSNNCRLLKWFSTMMISLKWGGILIRGSVHSKISAFTASSNTLGFVSYRHLRLRSNNIQDSSLHCQRWWEEDASDGRGNWSYISFRSNF